VETDSTLLRAYARTRDADSFRELVRRYAGYVFSIALRITGNRHDAEDVAQECFMALARSAGTWPNYCRSRAPSSSRASAVSSLPAPVFHSRPGRRAS
jgi:DNA-directed RNA polymerase specialized sigma24 family protein